MTRPELAVVIPAFNSENYIASTILSLNVAARSAGLRLRVVVVDDGSTDNTAERARSISTANLSVEVRRTANCGAFSARWEGAQVVDADWLLLLDSRQLVREDFLLRWMHDVKLNPNFVAWLSLVETDRTAPLVGHFWTIPTAVFWGGRLKGQATVRLTTENFDSVPKGTTALFIKKKVFTDACLDVWPIGDQRLVSDDTKLLRRVVELGAVTLDQELFSTYRPRTSFGPFLKHAYKRGTLFVDSYMSTSWSRFFSIMVLVSSPMVFVGLLIAFPAHFGMVFLLASATLAMFIFALTFLGLRNGAPPIAARSFVTYAVPFAFVFWAGLLRGIRIHGKSAFSEVLGR